MLVTFSHYLSPSLATHSPLIGLFSMSFILINPPCWSPSSSSTPPATAITYRITAMEAIPSLGNVAASASSSAESGGGEEADEAEVERALGMDGRIPGSSQEFVKRVSSRAYNLRRKVMQSLDSIAYDVLETNPWREATKPVYVLTQRDNQLWTMKTRRNHSEVESELGMLFAKGGRRGSGFDSKTKQSTGTKFEMLVEDITEGVLIFEDEQEAVKYCDILEGGGQGCEGIAEVEASSVFDICRTVGALAVLFRRGRTPPLPKSLEQHLRAKKRSLED
ncbi:hypothetical protein ZIOFF_062608 [Zingiber officinale]|uniref:Uncharacterized protein n=1 Tax=Zingiber officinale TaxID=94328 RepID=A0A8J5F5M1_ZINOF|nr:hypothetical protein ZIOFF_062608 [Zingiber officinale]